jgi:hypothetical protein
MAATIVRSRAKEKLMRVYKKPLNSFSFYMCGAPGYRVFGVCNVYVKVNIANR